MSELNEGTRPLSAETSRVTIEGAIFDCDGLIADTETPDYTSWLAVYEHYGLTLPLAEWAAYIGIAKGDDVRDWHAAVAAHAGPGYDRDAAAAMRHEHYYKAIDSLAPAPGLVPLLDSLQAANIPCAVASNSSRHWVRRILETTGLAGRFAAVATADQVATPKPAPDVYLLAAALLDARPTSCVAFEDSPRGLAAAVAAGMLSVAVPTGLTRSLDFSQADLVVSSLEEVTLDLLKKSAVRR
jgi:HAD superfamily hydrolase (TIGR01509 family)